MRRGEGSERDAEAGAESPAARRLPAWLALSLAALACWRIVYHSQYIRDVPFALATFSDGRQYELAARDILAHPPLGTEPFYLQGAYAYFMALPMAIRPWPSLALLTQVLLGALALWAFFRAVASWLGRDKAAMATVVLMAYPMVAFYETKFLTASLAVTMSIALLWTVARASEGFSWGRAIAVGVACGAAVLSRPNFTLLIPFVGVALWTMSGDRMVRCRALLGASLGLSLAIAPMSLRNLAVVGTPTIFPVHGGGTSFYIGNNRHARGVWNTAGGLLTGDVSRERDELLDELNIPRGTKAEEMEAVATTLYRRAFQEIGQDPGGWMWLELRKLWLVLGNDELSQDYDVHGEREMTIFDERIGVPFGALWVLGLVGAAVLREEIRRATPAAARRFRALAWTLVGLVFATLVANLLYFTSSQHRLPLAVPLALLTGLALPTLRRIIEDWPGMSTPRRRRIAGVATIAVLALGSTFIDRTKKDAPSAFHYYNLAVVCLSLDEPDEALRWMDRAIERNPHNAVLLIERATLRRQRGLFAEAAEDLAQLQRHRDVPEWIRARAYDEGRRVATRLNALDRPPVEAEGGDR